MYEASRDGYTVTTDVARFDVDAIHAFLTTSYWSAGIPLDTVRRAIAGSLAFGLLHGDRQIGFARLITDRATFAYLADVYVLDAYRGRGLGTWLVGTALAHPDVQGLRRLMLVTRDAHAVYAPFGFRALAAPDRHMEIARANLYTGS
jgi:GNAT superfamily N-acetyltransferase